jgi:hypothetical protein
MAGSLYTHGRFLRRQEYAWRHFKSSIREDGECVTANCRQGFCVYVRIGRDRTGKDPRVKPPLRNRSSKCTPLPPAGLYTVQRSPLPREHSRRHGQKSFSIGPEFHIIQPPYRKYGLNRFQFIGFSWLICVRTVSRAFLKHWAFNCHLYNTLCFRKSLAEIQIFLEKRLVCE